MLMSAGFRNLYIHIICFSYSFCLHYATRVGGITLHAYSILYPYLLLLILFATVPGEMKLKYRPITLETGCIS